MVMRVSGFLTLPDDTDRKTGDRRLSRCPEQECPRLSTVQVAVGAFWTDY